MSKTIRIDDEVYEGLKRLVTDPFEETPNTVIKKMLRELASPTSSIQPSKKKVGRAKPGVLTPQSVYENWLLYSLWKYFDGGGPKAKVTEKIINLMKDRGVLGAPDFELVKTGESKAVNTTAWARNKLKDEGKIKNTSLRGVWELSDYGIQTAQELEKILRVDPNSSSVKKMEGKVVEYATVSINEKSYRINRYASGTIGVFDEGSKKDIIKVMPFLREVVRTCDGLGVDLHNANGNEKNTRQLGKAIISSLNA